MNRRGYVDLLVTHKPAKPRNRKELAEMTTLLETLAENETKQTPAMERFIETVMALVLQFEEEIQPSPEASRWSIEILDGRAWSAAGGFGANSRQQVLCKPGIVWA